jgi:hypothetical protein
VQARSVARYVAHAQLMSGGRWNTTVTEEFGQARAIVAHGSAYQQTGWEDEAWLPLVESGWRLDPEARTELLPFGLLRREVEPPAHATATPVTAEEGQFVRRCLARRVSSRAALEFWAIGLRCPEAAATRYGHEMSLESYTALR